MLTALAVTLIGGVLASIIVGPRMLRRAAPALSRFPRTTVAFLGGLLIVWLGAVLALGPLLAWIVSGPILLSGQAAILCQQCLAASNPFPEAVSEAGVPAALLLGIPIGISALLLVTFTWHLLRRTRLSRGAIRRIHASATPSTVLGRSVLLLDDDRPRLFSVPLRDGGIVISTGALDLLDETELAATMAHEEAHIRQRHHLLIALIDSATRYFRWVPLIAAIDGALPHYLEIAADDRARHRVGTRPLISALVKLGDRLDAAVPAPASALHAAGPNRVARLVGDGESRSGRTAAVVLIANAVVLTAIIGSVYLPYGAAVLTGCGG